MATWALASSCPITVTTLANINDAHVGNQVLTRVGFWGLTVKPSIGVTITKAATFGGAQSAPSFPVTLDAARDLATELLKAVS
jgi:hypothetical protein